MFEKDESKVNNQNAPSSSKPAEQSETLKVPMSKDAAVRERLLYFVVSMFGSLR